MKINKLRILIVDDHEIVRRGVRATLYQRPNWQICGEARNGREAVDLCHECQPDIVVMDLSMPELNGVEATRLIRREQAAPEVVVFTMSEAEQMKHEVQSVGARGFVNKKDPEYHLIKAIEAVARRKSYVSSNVEGTLSEPFRPGNPRALKLTAREREILQMLTEGKNNKSVAAQLCISVKTVETHRATTMRKLEINSLVGLVHFAVRNQIVQA